MDRKPVGIKLPQSKPDPRQLSAFEVSIHLENQMDKPQKRVAIPKAGDPCPACQSAKIDYDSMLNLSCPDCSYTLAGCFT